MSNNQQKVVDEKKQDANIDQDLIGRNVCSCLPSEIWVNFFEIARHESINLLKLRLVCKQWQAVIDGNFNIKVKLDEDKMEVRSIINFRVVHCHITKFCGEYEPLSLPIQLFWNPKILTILTINGTITKPNFLLIAQECQFVTEFCLINCLPIGEPDVFEVVANEERDVLSKFMSGLVKLFVNVALIFPTECNPSPVNLYSLLNWSMPKLKTLVVRANFLDAAADKLFLGLLKNYGSLENIQFTFRNIKSILRVSPTICVLPTLSTLNIETQKGQRLRDWLPFVKAQSSIKHLKMVATVIAFDWDELFGEAILKNAKSLESLELRKMDHLIRRIDLHFLRDLSNLKSLIIQGGLEWDMRRLLRSSIVNLDSISDTTETMVLEDFECNQQEFALITDRVANLQTRNIVFS